MIVTIHQPSYMPWLPFLEKALRSDVFVFLDSVQFEKNSEQNRNKIKTATGPAWLTVPVTRQLTTKIPDVCIPNEDTRWKRKHILSIQQNYRKAPFFDEVAPLIFELLNNNWEKLLDLNLAVDRLFLEMVGFSGEIVRSSGLASGGAKSDLILSICNKLGASVYLSGKAGATYLDLEAFRDNGVSVKVQSYKHPEYRQLYAASGFLPGLSAIDFFLNEGVGEGAAQLVRQGGCWLDAEQRQVELPNV